MIIERAEHPDWLSNAYLVAEGPGGYGVLVDGNGVVEPLLDRVDEDAITITHVLVTHQHVDHVVGIRELSARFGDVPVVAHPKTARALDDGLVTQMLQDGEVLHVGGMEVGALLTEGHVEGHLCFAFDGTDVITADVLFKGTVGGTKAPAATGYADLKRSVLRLLDLPAETRLHPGHREPTTVADEWEHNPFVRVWRGLDPEGDEPCKVGDSDATLILWAPDYDGGNKAWVRWADGADDIVGGSRVTRS
jgi:glyoxylase-like metal-dependent hydrolase (beta-lactamase superfamily II)